MAFQRILVIRGGAIGDFVLTLPALRLLREEYSDAHIEILGYKHIVALAEGRYYAQATRSIEYAALASFFARGGELQDELSRYFGSFDLVISYLFDPDGIFQRNLDLSGVDYFLACSPKIGRGEHAAAQLARPLEQLDLRLSQPGATLYLSEADRHLARTFLQNCSRPVIAIHPGSGSERKNWPVERWREAGAALLANGTAASLLIIGGEAEQKQLAEFRELGGGEPRISFAQNLPLPELAAVLEQCALFLGHDSGISHIAAAVGTPSVLLFGPTDPAVWAPAHPHVQVLRSTSGVVADLPLDAVLAGAATLLSRYTPTS